MILKSYDATTECILLRENFCGKSPKMIDTNKSIGKSLTTI